MTTLSIQRTVDGVLTSAETARIQITDSGGDVVVPTTLVPPTSEGVYSYTATFLTPGTYTVTWTFVKTGQPDDIVSQVFQVDEPIQTVTGVLLMDIERGVARRVGPYKQYKALGTSTTSSLNIRALKSSITQGELEDLFILRRGVDTRGRVIPDFITDDRQRQVLEYIPGTGTITPDDPWELEPQENEVIEFHYLDPDQELRPAVLAALHRCYFWDRLFLATNTATQEIDVTASFPFVDSPALLVNTEYKYSGDIAPPSNLKWFHPVSEGGSVKLHTEHLGASNLWMTYLRPHSSFVNGETSLTGPNDDFDVMRLDVEYAIRASHVQCWLDLTDRLTTVAAQGLRLTPSQASAAFTQRSVQVMNQVPERWTLRWDTEEFLSQVGNAWGA